MGIFVYKNMTIRKNFLPLFPTSVSCHMEEQLSIPFAQPDSASPDEGGAYGSLPVVVDSRGSANITRIMQPKTVTYADFHFSKIHNQIFIRIKEELQLYIEKDLGRLKSNELIQVPLFCSHYPGFHGNSRLFYDSIQKLMSEANVVRFEWRFDASRHSDLYRWMMNAGQGGGRRAVAVPKDGALFQQASVLIVNAYRVQDDPDKLLVDINPKLVPFLLYYGEGNGGTAFNRDVALRLTSGYSFDMYYKICDWVTSCNSKTFHLEEFRRLFHIPAAYDVREINRRVLAVCKRELEEARSDIEFDYDIRYSLDYGLPESPRGRLKSNCVVLFFSRREKQDASAGRRVALQFLLKNIADKEKAHLCGEAVRIVCDQNRDITLMNKFQFYDQKVKDRRLSRSAFRNVMLKIVREMTGIDLRSDLHIRNAKIRERRDASALRDVPSLGEVFGGGAGGD